MPVGIVSPVPAGAQKAMDSYTALRQQEINELHPTDDDYEFRLMEAARRFRPFDAALDPFLAEHGYAGDMADAEAKVAFLRERFLSAGVPVPREIDKWYGEHRDIRRETAFALCFAFSLGLGETDDFFYRVFSRERSFDCHAPEEAVYYFCIRNRLPWAEAQRIIRLIPQLPMGRLDSSGEVLYTGSIMKELDRITDADRLIDYLTENADQFCYNNVTAFQLISRLWSELTDVDGLLPREQKELLPSEPSQAEESGRPRRVRKKSPKPMSSMEGWRAMLQIDRSTMADLNTGKQDRRSLSQVLALLPRATRDSFPDRQGIDLILRGEHVSYERVRKWLILLAFTRHWLRLALSRHSYGAAGNDEGIAVDSINKFLSDAGYMELYPGNPYDWIFLFSCHTEAPLAIFRDIWNTLLADVLEANAPANPN